MAEAVDTTGSDSAEKAYAAAAELAITQADSTKGRPDAEFQFPAKPMRIVASAASDAAVVSPTTEIIIPAELEAALVMKSKPPAKTAKATRPAPVAARKPASAKKVAVAKKPAAVVKPEAVVKKAVVKKAAASSAARSAKAAPAKTEKPAALAAPKFKTTKFKTTKIKTTAKSQPAFKEPKMATKKTKDYTATIKSAAADVQAKAKQALAKSNEVLGEASAFTKGNVEALVTSGKILGTGLKGLGKTFAAGGKSAYSTVTADVKELRAVKSPAQFVRLQTTMLRRNLDNVFDFGGKSGKAVLKLAGEVYAPISARANLAVAAVKKAA